ncbi:hypothetical protein D9M72_636990 [compost metagenome]
MGMTGMGAGRLRTLYRGSRRCCLAVRRQRDHCRADPGDFAHHALGGGAHRLQLLGPIGRHGDREVGLAVRDEDIRNEPELDDVAFHVRSAHGSQLIKNHVSGDFRHRALSFSVIP